MPQPRRVVLRIGQLDDQPVADLDAQQADGIGHRQGPPLGIGQLVLALGNKRQRKMGPQFLVALGAEGARRKIAALAQRHRDLDEFAGHRRRADDDHQHERETDAAQRNAWP